MYLFILHVSMSSSLYVYSQCQGNSHSLLYDINTASNPLLKIDRRQSDIKAHTGARTRIHINAHIQMDSCPHTHTRARTNTPAHTHSLVHVRLFPPLNPFPPSPSLSPVRTPPLFLSLSSYLSLSSLRRAHASTYRDT